MEKYFVDYNQALALNELGFNEPCLASWNFYTNEFNYNSYPSNFSSDDVIQLPLKSQVLEWFRQKHEVQSLIQEYMLNTYMYTIDDGINSDISVVGFETFEEAESACIDKLIEIVKNK